MIPSPALPWFELARFRRSRLARAAVVAVVLIPLLLAALYVWANINPTGHLDDVQAAVVNQDELVEVKDRKGEKQPVAVGRELAGNLTRDDSGKNFDWVLTDARDAQQGLANGEYKAVLTIPRNFSKAATSTNGDPDEAIQGNLDLRTNDADNYVSGTIAQAIVKAAKSALNAQVTETYLDNVYLSFSDIKSKLGEAASGAGDLSAGAGALADGASKAAGGAGELSNGLGKLESGTATLPRDTRKLADGARQVATGVEQIAALVQKFSQALTAATANADADIARLDTLLRGLAEQCKSNPSAGVDCKQIEEAAGRTGELKAFVRQVRTETAGAAGQVEKLAAGANQVAIGNEKLAQNVPLLVASISRAADGASQLADGTSQLASGADELSAGALELSTGLREGSSSVPDYNKPERDRMSKTVATPVQDAADRLHPVSNNGEALTPYFMALALWIGAMAIYLLLRPLSDRAVASTAGDVRTALAGLAPGLAISLAQAALLVAVLEWILGVNPASQLLFVGIAVATALAFTALNQMLVALLGGAGRFVALVLLALQLAAAGGTYPIETSPGFFGFLHDLLPMSYTVHGLRVATAGGSEGVGSDFFALAIFTVLGLALTVVAARRRQTVTLKRLHPSTA
ncbi:YhgE/Pip family protein [Aeromicrobium sp.]|uniref:YhgE/Pip family protein n=1 Tax=Aeromicrobium sp. TaxID=1871063 RepID=UPI003C59134D